jgi:hypothetical protein
VKRWLPIALVLAVSAVGLLALNTDSPGFDGDEAAILEPALNLAQGGTLRAPGFGACAGHEQIWVYQAPLHVALFAALIKLAGLSLPLLRASSAVLALLCGWLLYALARRLKAGPGAAALGALALLADPLVMNRGRMARYDFLAMALLLGALHAALSRRRGWQAGALSGLAMSAHVGYAVLAPASLLWALLRRRTWKGRLRLAVPWCAAFALGALPLLLRWALHFAEFREQFSWHVQAHEPAATGLWAALRAEAAKYAVLYKLAPIFPLVIAGSLALLWLRRDAHRGRAAREARRVLAYALASLGLLALFSHHHWHQIVILPALALPVALAFCRLWLAPRPRALAFAALAAALVALGIAPRLYAATRSRGMRDPTALQAELEARVPRGARVHGDYSLWFVAQRLGWRFTFEVAADCTAALLRDPPEFAIEAPERPLKLLRAAPALFSAPDRVALDPARFPRRLSTQALPSLEIRRRSEPSRGATNARATQN